MQKDQAQSIYRSACVGVVLLGSVLLPFIWPSTLLDIGYAHSLLTAGPGGFERVESTVAKTDTYREFNESVNLVTFKNGSRLFTHNGYTSTHFTERKKGILRETIVGVAPYLFSQGTENALQIGVGGGITAGSLGYLYDNTTAVEINPAVIEMLPTFSEENLNVLNNPNVDIQIQDGVLLLYKNDKKYDLIVNSVPSPVFYSASKLWTKNVFDLISSRLASGGVYSGWFDARLGERGVKILFRTLEESFADCRFFFLTARYYNVVCGNEDLSVARRPSDEAFPELVQKQFTPHNIQTSIYQFILDISAPFSLEHIKIKNVPANTFDRPVLEFQTTPTYYQVLGGRSTVEFLESIKEKSDTDRQIGTRECQNKSIMVSSDILHRLFPACDG